MGGMGSSGDKISPISWFGILDVPPGECFIVPTLQKVDHFLLKQPKNACDGQAVDE